MLDYIFKVLEEIFRPENWCSEDRVYNAERVYKVPNSTCVLYVKEAVRVSKHANTFSSKRKES